MKAMKNHEGFTIVEVVVAILILTVGLLALAHTAGAVTRMVGQGQRFTYASNLANERFEILRSQRCPSMSAGSESRGSYSLTWAVTATGGGGGNEVIVNVTSPTGRGNRTDIFRTVIPC